MNVVYPVHHATAGEIEDVKVGSARTGCRNTKSAVQVDDAFRVTRSRESKHEDEPPIVETEFAASHCGGDAGNRTPVRQQCNRTSPGAVC